MREVLSLILGGGRGTRLYPLTKMRSKPAVPVAGKYRLIDIPISNCINSGFNRVYVLTQFLSVSLHRHIANTYKFDMFSRGFVEKPKSDDLLAPLRLSADWLRQRGVVDPERQYLANMGIYLFKRRQLLDMLNTQPLATDFGKEVFPRGVQTHKIVAHVFDGYWEDLGTIRAYHEANLALAGNDPPFDFHSPEGVIYTRMRNLP